MIHMLTAAIMTETNDTLHSITYNLPLVGDFGCRGAFHTDVNVECDSSDDAQTNENDCSDNEAGLFCHFDSVILYYYKSKWVCLKSECLDQYMNERYKFNSPIFAYLWGI